METSNSKGKDAVVSSEPATKAVKKCYVCRTPIKGDSLFCKKCEEDPEARKGGSSTLVFYHTV